MAPADLLTSAPRTRVGPYRVGRTGVVVESSSAAMAQALDVRLADLREPGAQDDVPVVLTVDRQGPDWSSHPWGVWRDGVQLATALDARAVAPYVVWEITRLLLERVDPLVPVYAGAVTRGGGAIVLAGHPRARTSTLAAWLATRGWELMTTEVAVLDVQADRTVVRPLHLPVSIQRGGPLGDVLHPDDPADPADAGDPVLVPPSRLGSLVPTPVPVSAVVLARHTPMAPAGLEPLTPAETLVGLGTHLPQVGRRGRRSFGALAHLAESVPGYALTLDDLDEAESSLRSLTGGGPA